MKLLTILGARPQFIEAARVSHAINPLLDQKLADIQELILAGTC